MAVALKSFLVFGNDMHLLILSPWVVGVDCDNE